MERVVNLDQEQFTRWIQDVDPVIRRLEQLCEDVMRARTEGDGNLVELLSNEAPAALLEMSNALIDAKTRMLGIDMEKGCAG